VASEGELVLHSVRRKGFCLKKLVLAEWEDLEVVSKGVQSTLVYACQMGQCRPPLQHGPYLWNNICQVREYLISPNHDQWSNWDRELLGYVTYISTWWYRCVYMYLGDELIPHAFELLRLPEIVCDVPLSVLQGEGSAGGVLLQLFDQDSATLHPGNGDCNSLHSAQVVRK
jgi:hypothetical protein